MSSSPNTPSPTTAATTATSLLALTTPFIQPPECASIWSLTSGTFRSYPDDETASILVSDQADPRFTSCQPLGWDHVAPTSRFSFSPAVCPSGWVYYDMRTTSKDIATVTSEHNFAKYSMAYCCARGYETTHGFPISSMPLACARSVNSTEITIWPTGTSSKTGYVGPTPLFTKGYLVHEPWHISWAKSDRSTLGVSLPDLTSGMLVPTWTPGETIPPGKYDGMTSSNQNDLHGLNQLFLLYVIGLPLIALTVAGCCAFCFVRSRRGKRTEKQAAGPARQQRQNQEQEPQQREQLQQEEDEKTKHQ